MQFSFIVTSYNIEDYIGSCLDSLRPCLQPGDQLILVDDGSTDHTADDITNWLQRTAPLEGVEVCPVFLGANTEGGVGIPANIGLQEVRRAAVFFVDGDDWLNAEGFRAARRRFERGDCDLLIANYSLYDEASEQASEQASAQASAQVSAPADQPLWREASRARTPEARRDLALRMIGVPWRKIYRASFLQDHAIRFPEGPFFYEDNPFHWRVCLAAENIVFVDRGLCFHRVNRVGQTMAAQGAELEGFFSHYEAIIAALPNAGKRGRHPRHFRAAALRWLLENMAWHVERLRPQAYWSYACRAEETLSVIPEADWQELRHCPVAQRSWAMARALARGDVAAVVADWRGQETLRRLEAVTLRLDQVEHNASRRVEDLQAVRHWAEAEREIAAFEALAALQAARQK
ncbi:glycosyltransferase family 2 protein [Pseudophaeobacter leonis]|uniref:glycosyltransferase family 2 protein n=1 Tax=Pseudophaeobacter leonis TaxID=1144477 RepID=UPI0009F3DEE0|nr:glycosyltransferase [Pseudophaeobacter leonis]